MFPGALPTAEPGEHPPRHGFIPEAAYRPDDVIVLDAQQPTDCGSEPTVIAAMPGSLFVDSVASTWARRGRLADLAEVSGPWGVALAMGADRWVVTDPIGVQPVFWARTSGGQIAVASWLAALVDRSDVSDALDYEGILLLRGMGFNGEEMSRRTEFAAVGAVPAGHALHIRPDGSTQLVRYFDSSALPGSDKSLSLMDCADAIREAVDRAVRKLTPTDRPVGAHVSGGLDCTSIACRAQQVLRESGSSLVAGYSWTPDVTEVPRFDGDERGLLDDVSAQEGLPIRSILEGEEGDWFFSLDRHRYPQSTHVRERYVLPQAAADGVQVMLSGWGGDELASFNGRAVRRHLVRTGRLDALWAHDWARLRRDQPDRNRISRALRAWRGPASAVHAELPDRLSLGRREYAADRKAREERWALLADFSPLAAEAARQWYNRLDGATDHHAFQLCLLASGHLQHRTSGWYQTGRLFGVDYRYPLLDLGVVRTALRLPWWAYLSHGWSRIGYRLAVEPWVPPSVAWNPRKVEPALFWPPGGRTIHQPRVPLSDPSLDDPEFARVRDLLAATWPDGGNPIDPRDGVRPRPDAAPRVARAAGGAS